MIFSSSSHQYYPYLAGDESSEVMSNAEEWVAAYVGMILWLYPLHPRDVSGQARLQW